VPAGDYLLEYTTTLGTFHIVFQAGNHAIVHIGLQEGDSVIEVSLRNGNMKNAVAKEVVLATIWENGPVNVYLWPGSSISTWEELFEINRNIAPVVLIRGGQVVVSKLPPPPPTSIPTRPGTAPGPVSTPNPTMNSGIVVPAYFYPDLPGGYWQQLVEAAVILGDRLIVIANPFNGPGTSQNSDYTNAMNAVRSAGGKVIGYVHTSYSARAMDDVKADIDKWYNWYSIDGIFFDEVATGQSRVNHYQGLYDDVQQKQSGATVVFNHGTTPHSDYFGIGSAIFCIFEDEFSNFNGWSFQGGGSSRDSLVLVHNTSNDNWQAALEQIEQEGIGWLYVTSDKLPNPWDTLPSYFSDMVKRISN